MGVLAEMLVQFFGAVPAVRRIRGLVPGRALQAVLRRHTDAKLGSMFGDDDDDDAGRSRLVFARDAFVAMSGDLFAGADLYPNAAAWDMDDTRLPLLRDISRVVRFDSRARARALTCVCLLPSWTRCRAYRWRSIGRCRGARRPPTCCASPASSASTTSSSS